MKNRKERLCFSGTEYDYFEMTKAYGFDLMADLWTEWLSVHLKHRFFSYSTSSRIYCKSTRAAKIVSFQSDFV